MWEKNLSTLCNLITTGKKNILLLGDAGSGKSTELKQLSKGWIDAQHPDYIPILIDLNTYVDQEIIDYIISQIGADSKDLLLYNNSKLVFLFDEFDQVLNKEIATRKLKTFIEVYKESIFVISCRTNFYSGQFEDFTSFVILPFNSEDISTYAIQRLQLNSGMFLAQLKQSSLFEVAKNPLFLKYLTDIFAADNKIPNKLSDIISRIINLILENDSRRLSSKYDLRQKYPIAQIKEDLANISLVMETLQRNYLSIEECNKLFRNDYKQQVVTGLSLLKKAFPKTGDAYQFIHNTFQEELAAEMLANLNLSDILEFISYPDMDKKKWIDRIQSIFNYIDLKPFGIHINKLLLTILDLAKRKNNIKRINPSWANTVAFLCLLRKESDLFEYLMKNEPELALKFEISRVIDEEKEKLFKTIFDKYTAQQLPIDRNIDYEELARFGGKSGQPC